MNKAEKLFLFNLMKDIPENGVVVEIGSWTGGSALEFAKGILKFRKEDANLICVDPWDYEGDVYKSLKKAAKGRDIKAEFDHKLKPYSHTTLQMTSAEASRKVPDNSVDLLFLDGDHTFVGVSSDLDLWIPRVRPGGIICGHDFNRREYGVTEAVKERFTNYSNPARSLWLTTK